MEAPKKTHFMVSLVGICLLGFYVIAALYPDSWWGLHFIAFFPPIVKWLFFGIAFGVILFFLLIKKKINLPAIKVKFISPFIFIVVAIAMGLVYYNFPVYKSLYGDSEMFQEKMGERTEKNQDKYLQSLVSPNVFHPKIGNMTVLSGVRLLSYKYGVTHRRAYRWIDAVSGFLFVLLWLFFINWYLEDSMLKWVFYIIGLTAPIGIFFFGYEEIYAPSIPISAAYLMALVAYFKTKRVAWLYMAPVLLFLSLKVHSVFVLLIPSLIFAVLFHVLKGNSKWLAYLEWKRLAIWFFLPLVLFGLAVYFFVTKDYNDPRFVGPEVDVYGRTFLPILASQPPLDRYTMFHYYHFFDYFNMAFLWSAGAIFALISCVFFFRKAIDWNRPTVIAVGVTMLLFLMVYFAYNPLMSMPVDFDLYTLPGTTLLVLAAVVCSQVKVGNWARQLAGPVIGLGLLSISVFVVNSNSSMLSQRMHSLGVHVFKSYWIRSAGDIRAGAQLINNTDEKIRYYQSAIEKLESYAIEGKDPEYANLLLDLAKIYRNEKQDLRTAFSYHQQALRYDQSSGVYYIGLVDAAFRLDEYDLALAYSQKLIAYHYPSEQQALKIARDCAIMANQYQLALQYCDTYLNKWPDEDMAFVKSALTTGEYLEEIKMALLTNSQ